MKPEYIALRFIGADGSMGLKHGRIYPVKVYSTLGKIVVDWNNGRCPYSSPSSFATNWAKVEITGKREE